MDAIRYGEDPAVRARMDQAIEGALDSDHLKEIMRRNALVESHMGMEGLYAIKEQMEKAEARVCSPFLSEPSFRRPSKGWGICASANKADTRSGMSQRLSASEIAP
jgi:hypothetical protein